MAHDIENLSGILAALSGAAVGVRIIRNPQTGATCYLPESLSAAEWERQSLAMHEAQDADRITIDDPDDGTERSGITSLSRM